MAQNKNTLSNLDRTKILSIRDQVQKQILNILKLTEGIPATLRKNYPGLSQDDAEIWADELVAAETTAEFNRVLSDIRNYSKNSTLSKQMSEPGLRVKNPNTTSKVTTSSTRTVTNAVNTPKNVVTKPAQSKILKIRVVNVSEGYQPEVPLGVFTGKTVEDALNAAYNKWKFLYTSYKDFTDKISYASV